MSGSAAVGLRGPLRAVLAAHGRAADDGEPFGVEYRIVDSWGTVFVEDRDGRALTDWYVAHETATEMDEVYPDYAPHRVEARTVCPWMPCATGDAA